MPLGHSAMGIRSVSCVGVTGGLGQPQDGPQAHDEQEHEHQRMCSDAQAVADAGALPVAVGDDAALLALARRPGSAPRRDSTAHQLAQRPGEPEVDRARTPPGTAASIRLSAVAAP